MFKSILILILLSLFVGTGAWLFFIWSVKKGAYDDIERAKYRMLDDDDGPRPKDQNKKNTTSTDRPTK